MTFEIRIPLPEPMLKDIGLNVDTPLETYFEDGELVVRDCDDEQDDDPFPDTPSAPCQSCGFFCPVHQVCTKNFHIDEEEF